MDKLDNLKDIEEQINILEAEIEYDSKVIDSYEKLSTAEQIKYGRRKYLDQYKRVNQKHRKLVSMMQQANFLIQIDMMDLI